MVSRASDTFLYDNDGNLILAVENGDETRYAWSSDNRLAKVEKDIECEKHNKKKCGKCPQVLNFTTAEEYGYLPEDWRRITRTITAPEGHGYGHGNGHDCNDIPGDGWGHYKDGRDSATFVSIFQGADESHEYLLETGKDRDDKDEKGKKCPDKYSNKPRLNLVREFIGGPGIDDLEITRFHGRSFNMLKDSLGSTIALTNRGGSPVAKIGYDVWGNLKFPDKPGYGVPPNKYEDLDGILDRFDSGRSIGFDHDSDRFGRHFGRAISPYLYTGRRLDNFSKLYNSRNRMLNPRVGRFISRDPIGFDGGNNLWGYAGNNPVAKTDPSGLYPYVLVADDADPFRRGLYQSLIDGHGGWFYDTPRYYRGTEYSTIQDLFDAIYSEAVTTGAVQKMVFIGHGNENAIAIKYGHWLVALGGGVSPMVLNANGVLKIQANFQASCRDPHNIFAPTAYVYFLGCNVGKGLLPAYFSGVFLNHGYVGAFKESLSTWDLYIDSQRRTLASPYFMHVP